MDVKEKSRVRKAKLNEALDFHNFKRDGDEVKNLRAHNYSPKN